MKTVVIVAGTRPEAIKLVPVYQELRRSSSLQPLWLSTAQHRDMLDQALDSFGIAADVDLDVMQPDQTLTALTARLLTDVGRCLAELTPDAVLVQGDTATVLATAIAAFYARLPIGHVEAGLRTYEDTPWPEEMNRRLVDPMSRWCFAPTELAAANLRAERVPAARISLTGNTGIDALRLMQEGLAASPPDRRALARRCGIPSEFSERFLGRPDARWILVTGHRRESFEGGFERICAAIAAAAAELPDVGFLYPLHLNPKVREPVRRALGGRRGITLIEPVGYADFVWLMSRCTLLLSDSGGVQEEAPSLGKPVLVLRDVTERPEGVEAGTCRLVGTDPARILGELRLLLGDEAEYRRRSALRNPYGDGHASERIRAVLERDLA